MDRSRPAALRWVSLISLVLTLSFTALAHWQPASAATTQGTIQGFQFQLPASVSPGDTITWTNNDSAPHTVTSDTAGVFNVSVPAGQSANMTAPAAGTYTFHCSIHPNMKATLVVAAAGQATSTAPGASPATAAPATSAPGSSATVAPGAPSTGNTGSSGGGSGSYSSDTVLLFAALAGLVVVVAGGAAIYRWK